MPDLNNISLTVSIVSYDSPEQDLKTVLRSLLACLARLSDAGYRMRSRLVFVDNSDDNRLELALFREFTPELESLDAELSILKGHGNIGYGSGHNLVIQPSTDTYHLILNPDVELDPHALVAGIEFLQQHAEVAIVSPYATAGDGNKQHLCKRYPALSTFIVRGFFPAWLKQYFSKSLSHYEMHDLPEDQPTHTVPMVSGCFMLCRTENLRAVSGFDEKYFMYFEDFDLCLRVGKTAKLAYLPTMKIRHLGGHAAGKGRRHIAMFIKSGFRFFSTYGWRLIQ